MSFAGCFYRDFWSNWMGYVFTMFFFEFHKFGILLVTLWASGGHPGGRSTFFNDFGSLVDPTCSAAGLCSKYGPVGGPGATNCSSSSNCSRNYLYYSRNYSYSMKCIANL